MNRNDIVLRISDDRPTWPVYATIANLSFLLEVLQVKTIFLLILRKTLINKIIFFDNFYLEKIFVKAYAEINTMSHRPDIHSVVQFVV